MSEEEDPKFVYNFGAVKYPKIPHTQRINKLRYGDQLFFRGSIPGNCKRFAIDVLAQVPGKGQEIAFHLNPRWDDKSVVRNSREDRKWGKEEVTGGTGALSSNSSFEISYLVLEDKFRVALQKKHFCDFEHRMPVASIYGVKISGDVTLHSFHIQPGYETSTLLPKSTLIPPNPVVPSEKTPKKVPRAKLPKAEELPVCFGYLLETPFFGHIPGGLAPGKVIFLTVIPNKSSRRWRINFWTKAHSMVNLALHFDVRHNQKKIVMNSTNAAGKWEEELPTPHMPVKIGRHTDVVIMCEKDQFVISLYNNHFVNFKHRYTRLEDIKVMSVEEDCSIVHLRVQ